MTMKSTLQIVGRLLTPLDTYEYKWTTEGNNGKCIMQCTALV